jgi:hypothetical protein
MNLALLSLKEMLLNNRGPAFFPKEYRRAVLLALVFSQIVALVAGCSSTGKGFNAGFIAPATNAGQRSSSEDDSFYHPVRSPAFDEMLGS